MFLRHQSSMEKELKELEQQYESIQRQIKDIYHELECNPTEALAYLNNPENFSEEEWGKIQEKRKELHASLFDEHDNSRVKLSPQPKSLYEQMLASIQKN